MQQNKGSFSINIPDSSKPRVVIIGGGFGGMNVLKGLSGNQFQLVLLDRYNYHTFQPLLYQVSTAGLEPDSIAGPLRKLARKKIDLHFRMLSVIRIEPQQKIIHTLAGKLRYDYLVIGTGSGINFFGKKDFSKYSYPLKQITHALDLRSKIFQQFEKLEILGEGMERQDYFNFVVVGAGPTGVELCGALSELKKYVLPRDYPELNFESMQIYLVEGLDRVLPNMSPNASRKAEKYLKKMGIKVLLNCLTESYDGTTVKLHNHEDIRTETLIWAAGVKGNIIEGFEGGSKYKGRLATDVYSRVYRSRNERTVFHDIFAIGDVAYMETAKYPDGLPGLATTAIQQGKRLAENLNRERAGLKWKEFRYRNKGVLATIGRNRAVVDLPGNLRISGLPGWLFWMGIHLMYLVGFRNKAVVFTNWFWNYFTYDRGIRLIIRPADKEDDPVTRQIYREMKEN